MAEALKLSVVSGDVATHPNLGEQIWLKLTPESSKDLADFSMRHVGKSIEVLVDHQVVAKARLNDAFIYSGNELQIPIPARPTSAKSSEMIGGMVSQRLSVEIRIIGSL